MLFFLSKDSQICLAKQPRSNDIPGSAVVLEQMNLLKGIGFSGENVGSRFGTGNNQMSLEYLVGPKSEEARKPAKTNRVISKELGVKLKRLPLAKVGAM